MLETAFHLFRVVVNLDLKAQEGLETGYLLIKLEARGLIALNSRHGVESGSDSVLIFTYTTFLDSLQAKHNWELINKRPFSLKTE